MKKKEEPKSVCVWVSVASVVVAVTVALVFVAWRCRQLKKLEQAKDAEIAELTSKLTGLNTQLNEMYNAVNNLTTAMNAAIAAKTTQLDDCDGKVKGDVRDELIAQLKADITSKESKLETSSRELGALRLAIAKLSNQLAIANRKQNSKPPNSKPPNSKPQPKLQSKPPFRHR